MNLPIPTATLAKLNPHLFAPWPTPGTGGVARESELHDQIFDECRSRGWIVLHGSMAERTSRTLGEPDFVILADGGRVLFVECKSRTGKLSPAQLALKHHAEKLGHTVHVVRSLGEFLRIASEATVPLSRPAATLCCGENDNGNARPLSIPSTVKMLVETRPHPGPLPQEREDVSALVKFSCPVVFPASHHDSPSNGARDGKESP